jgi:hypothetical protein
MGSQMESSANMLSNGISVQSSNQTGVISSQPRIVVWDAIVNVVSLLDRVVSLSSPSSRKESRMRYRWTTISMALSANVKRSVPARQSFMGKEKGVDAAPSSHVGSCARIPVSSNSSLDAPASIDSPFSTFPPNELYIPWPKPRCFIPRSIRRGALVTTIKVYTFFSIAAACQVSLSSCPLVACQNSSRDVCCLPKRLRGNACLKSRRYSRILPPQGLAVSHIVDSSLLRRRRWHRRQAQTSQSILSESSRLRL